MTDKVYQTFEQFYPFYLSQHSNRTCRRLHVIGSTLAILQLINCIFVAFTLMQFLLVFIIGYGFAWVGHFVFQKNKPATFKEIFNYCIRLIQEKERFEKSLESSHGFN